MANIQQQPIRTVIPDDFPIAYGGLQHAQLARLVQYGEVVCHSTRYADRSEFFERIAGAQAAINVRAYSMFDKEAFDHAPRLGIVSILGTGAEARDCGSGLSRRATPRDRRSKLRSSHAHPAFAVLPEFFVRVQLAECAHDRLHRPAG